MYFAFDLDGTIVNLNLDKSKISNKIKKIGGKYYHIWTLLLYQKEFFIKNKNKIYNIFKECELEIIKNNKEVPLEFMNVLKKIDNYSIVTNNSIDVASMIVKKYNLKPDLIIGRESVEFPKPYPDPLNKLIDEFNLNRDEVLFVGDTIWDAMMAKAANVLFLSVNIDSKVFLKFVNSIK